MKEYLVDLVRQTQTPGQERNLAREYLQALILAGLQRAGAMIPLAFHGGTALRFLYSHGRYSEDLDFALEGDRLGYDFRRYLQAIRSDLERQGYRVELKLNDQKTVHSAFVRFPGLLFDLGLSPLRSQVLAVKIEVDTNPPLGAGLFTSVVRRHVLLQLQHYDRPSLLSGKLHAIFARPYSKGRDLYDLLWYLGDSSWPQPNLEFLNNALAQTGWQGETLTPANWKENLRTRLQAVNWKVIVEDVRPFVEPGFDPGLLTLENLQQVLDNFQVGDRAGGKT